MTQPTESGRGRQTVDEIKEKVSIVDIVSRYVTLSPGGRNLRGCCPLHGEKTPSFYVSPDDGYWKCFGCGKGGDVIKFIEEIEKVSFKEALAFLAEIAGIPLHYDRSSLEAVSADTQYYAILARAKQIYMSQLVANSSARDYVMSRGVSAEMIEKFQIGYAPDDWQTVYNQIRREFSDEHIIASGIGIQGNKGVYDRFRSRIMFPTHDVRDRVVTFSGRIWSASGEYRTERQDTGKYVNGPESPIYHKSRTLFGLNLARQAAVQKKRLIIVEGHLDCVMSHQAGFVETVAVGGTALTSEHIDIIKRYCDQVVLAFDGDSAGQKAILRSLPVLFEHDVLVAVARFPDAMDPADLIVKNPGEYRQAIESSTDYISHRLKILQSEGLPLADIDRILRQEIYPLIALIHNPLLVDSAVTTISRSMGISDSVIREHIKETMKHTSRQVDGASPHISQSSVLPIAQTVRDFALRFAAVWQALESNAEMSYNKAGLIEYLRGSTGLTIIDPADLAKLYAIDYSEYGLRYEWLYGNQSPSDVIAVIIRQFAESYIRDTMQRHITSLHQAVDESERRSLEQSIVELSHYKRYSEIHQYAN
jgi:DNA primase